MVRQEIIRIEAIKLNRTTMLQYTNSPRSDYGNGLGNVLQAYQPSELLVLKYRTCIQDTSKRALVEGAILSKAEFQEN